MFRVLWSSGLGLGFRGIMFQDINDNKGFKFKGHVAMDVV